MFFTYNGINTLTPSKFISLKTVIIAVCRMLTSLFSELCENARGHNSILCYKSSDAKWPL